MIKRLLLTPYLNWRCNRIGGKVIPRIGKDRWAFWDKYREYTKSKEWQARRELVKMRDGGRCRMCGSKPAYNVHHLTYERVGKEKLGDLLLVCDACHKDEHPR